MPADSSHGTTNWKARYKSLDIGHLRGDTSSVEDDQIPAMVELCKVLLFRKVWNDRFDSAMIHFMAVMGIDETNARLRDGNDYSYMIAGLVYVSRLVAAEALLPSLERENQGEAEFEAFLERRKNSSPTDR
ncbi:unnamed protein product [Aureobasidium pullulans]|nr:unnamed protein product [Aureobasidium pullulans]